MKQSSYSKQEISSKQGSFSKQNSSSRQNGCRKRNSLSKHEVSSKTLIDIDPNTLVEKLQIIWAQPIKTKTDVMPGRMIIGELLGTKNVTRREYNTPCKKCDF